ncbi:MAG: DUF4442 domain-containing protein [Pseudomonadota bacterium]
MKAKTLKRLMNIWPPFIGAGIRVEEISPDYQYARVAMRLRWYNRNYVNAHFGGSLYAMTDPFYMLLMMQNLGKKYIVWDQSGSVEYVKPGKGRVVAEFKITEDMIHAAHQATQTGEKYLPDYTVRVVDENDDIVAIIHKKLYIRLKKQYRNV